MLTYEIELKGFEEQIAKLKQVDRLIDRRFKPAFHGSVIGIQSHARRGAPVFRGRLRNSIASEVSGFGSNLVGKVGSTIREEYPEVMEFGRKPGAKMPPPAALERWVQLQLKVPKGLSKGVAFVVARSIGRKGIKGRRFMTKAVDATKVRVGMLLRHALQQFTDDLRVK